MKVYTLIQLTGLDVTSVETFIDLDVATKNFNQIAEEETLEDADLKHLCSGTLKGAGDDAFFVQLIESEPK